MMGETALAEAGARSAPEGLLLFDAGTAGTTSPGDAGQKARRDVGAYAVAARKTLPVFAWGVLPALFTLLALLTEARLHKFTGDAYYAFWPAGRSVLHGSSPYLDPSSPLVARSMAFVYPAVSALLMAPLALVGRVAGDELLTAFDILAVLGTLRVLEVRDWRVYGVSLLWPAVFAGWAVSNITLLLGLGVALIWRYRDRPVVGGMLVAVLVSIKLFLWPLAIWLLATRRYAALASSVVAGVLINAVAWAVLGFGEVHRYTRLLHALTATEGRRGYGVIALALNHGIGSSAAYALALALAGLCLGACVAICRRGDQVGALALALAASLLATPLVWLHYFAVLIVPLAIARPRLHWIWTLPLLTWMYPIVRPASWQVLVAIAVAMGLVAAAFPRHHSAQPGLAV